MASRLENEHVFEILSRLPNPVLGCGTRPESQGHVNVPCFGGLDEEWLLARLLALPDTVQLNLTTCDTCRNRTITADVSCHLENIVAHVGIAVSQKIRLVENRADLVYEAHRFERRRFFRAFGTKVLKDIQRGMPSRPLRYGNAAYTQKTLPVKRERLNQCVRNASADLRKKILARYYYTIECFEHCNACSACAAVCPTGALEFVTTEQRLQFDPARCVGCNVCAEFCRQNAIQVHAGWFRDTLTPIRV